MTADFMADGTDIPAGWTPFDLEFGFARSFGQVSFRETGDQRLELGFRCGERHLNPLGMCHGGAIAAFADYAALGAQYAVGLSRIVTPTVTLSVDFLQGILPGQWVAARVDIIRQTRKMCFTQMVARVGDEPVMNSRGIFKISSRAEHIAHPFYVRCAELWPSRVLIDAEDG